MTKLSALFCAAMAALGVIASYPVLASGFCDDFSYAKTSLELVKTGHLLYNGWATAMLGWQVYWGALVIQVFGFSFLALRLSTLPFAMGSAVLLFSICQRAGLNKGNSLLCSLTLVLSPVFVPLAASFMTDVPALFWTLVCLYFCIRAVMVTASGSRGALAWLTLGTLVSLMAGTGRQTAWLGALVMVPSAAWLLRSHRSIPRIVAALWIFSLAIVLLCMTWFKQQPYSVPEQLAGGHATILALCRHMAMFGLTTFLFSLPALAGYLPMLWGNWRNHLLPLLAITAAIVYMGVGLGWRILAPWMMGMVTPIGVDGDLDLLGLSPIVLTTPVRVVVTVFAAAVLYAFITFAVSHVRANLFSAHHRGRLSWYSMMCLLAPFTLVYLALMMPRSASEGVTGVNVFDRYTICLLPVVAIIALRLYQEQIRPGVPFAATFTLTVFGAFAVASTHDCFATQRAAVAAASSLTHAGIPRTAIQASFDYDGWTELETSGHLNDARILFPKSAYHEAESTVPANCRSWFASHTPSVKPTYFVVSSSLPCLAPTAFPSVSYRTWLPPFQREIFIQKLNRQIASR